MKLSFGAHQHDDNEVWFDTVRTEVLSAVGRRTHYHSRTTIWGVLLADSVSALTTKMDALAAAYAAGGKDLIFYLSDGTTETHHKLLNSTTLGGTKVTAFRWLPGNGPHWGSGAEYVNKRSYQIVIEADVLDYESNIVSWQESVRTIGDGGARWKLMGAITGAMQIQQLQQFTPITAIQSGHAVGLLSYPFAPSPIWPSSMHGDRLGLSQGTPRFHPVQNTHYPVSWSYVFESSAALVGGPTLF